MGTKKRPSVRLPPRIPPQDEAQLPNLRRHGYKVTSNISTLYNCVAHAASDQNRKWEPGFYWPPGALHKYSIDALISAFSAIGFNQCTSPDLEQGYEKVALFEDNLGRWTHAALQLDTGYWSSKLGDSYDIRHKSPHSLTGPAYGTVACYMSRIRNQK